MLHVLESPMSDQPVNHNPSYNPHQAAGQLRQALARDEDQAVIDAYRRRVGVGSAERALARALASAPPLTHTQIAYLRGVLASYAEGGETEAGQ
jgi:hypothetical protein